MSKPHHSAILAAIYMSSRSTCAKSKRGVSVFDPRHDPWMVVAAGANGPPPPFVCSGSEVCRAACSKICEHAEAAALRVLGRTSALGFDMVHLKTVDGEPVASGGPSCVECSKAILADGRIAGVWLMHSDGWRRYDVVEFHLLSAGANGVSMLSREVE